MIEKLLKRFTDKVNFTEDCWLWNACKNESGYGEFKFEGKRVKAHRYAWEVFNGKIPNDMCLLHKCDVRLCVNPSHLFIGTKQDNSADMVAKQRSPRGEKSGQAKLTESQVEEIRKTYKKVNSRWEKSEHTLQKLAVKYGVSLSTIYKVVNEISW